MCEFCKKEEGRFYCSLSKTKTLYMYPCPETQKARCPKLKKKRKEA